MPQPQLRVLGFADEVPPAAPVPGRPEERAPDAYLMQGGAQPRMQQAQQAVQGMSAGTVASSVDAIAQKIPWFAWLGVGIYAGWTASNWWSGRSSSKKKD